MEGPLSHSSCSSLLRLLRALLFSLSVLQFYLYRRLISGPVSFHWSRASTPITNNYFRSKCNSVLKRRTCLDSTVLQRNAIVSESNMVLIRRILVVLIKGFHRLLNRRMSRNIIRNSAIVEVRKLMRNVT